MTQKTQKTEKHWRVLVTGATGRIGFPIARELARDHTVYGLARCSKVNDIERLREAGVEPIVGDVAEIDLDALPPDLDYVFHAAARIGKDATDDWQKTFDTNHDNRTLDLGMQGRLWLCLLFLRIHVTYQGRRPLHEDDPPGVHLGVYSLSKIAGEAVARFAAEDRGVPLSIIRIFSTYGPLGGAPADRFDRIRAGEEVVLHPDAPNNYNPIYEDDYVRLGIKAMQAATIPALTVNWAGSETVSAEEYCAYLGELIGKEVRIRYDERAPWPLWPDVERMHQVLGHTQVNWRDGMQMMAQHRMTGAV